MKGLYTLVIHIPKDMVIKIGSLGNIKLSKGYYAYIGSGGASILKRVGRHFMQEKRVKWHIDYVTVVVKPLKAYILIDPPMDESSLAEYLGGYFRHIHGFGASDSRYVSHFFYLGSQEDVTRSLRSLLESRGCRVLEYFG